MALPLTVLLVDQRGLLLVQRAALVIHLLPAVASMMCNVGDDTAQAVLVAPTFVRLEKMNERAARHALKS
jgi:hypothetical protein